MNSDSNSPENVQPQSPGGPFAKAKPMHGVPVSGQNAQVILIQPTNSVLKRWIAWLGWLGFGFCLIALMGMSFTLQDYLNPSNDLQEKYVSGSKSLTGDKVAHTDDHRQFPLVTQLAQMMIDVIGSGNRAAR